MGCPGARETRRDHRHQSRAVPGVPTGQAYGMGCRRCRYAAAKPKEAILEGPGPAQGGIDRSGCNLWSLHGFILLCVSD